MLRPKSSVLKKNAGYANADVFSAIMKGSIY